MTMRALMLGAQIMLAIMVFAANVAVLVASVRKFPPNELHVGTYKTGTESTVLYMQL
jgi:hypothetical protein